MGKKLVWVVELEGIKGNSYGDTLCCKDRKEAVNKAIAEWECMTKDEQSKMSVIAGTREIDNDGEFTGGDIWEIAWNSAIVDSMWNTYNSACENVFEGLSEDLFVDKLVDIQESIPMLTVELTLEEKEYAKKIARDIYNNFRE